MSSFKKPPEVITLCARAFRQYDERLVNHGIRTAYISNFIFDELCDNYKNQISKTTLFKLVLCHDLGAYKTEDIDNLLSFEATATHEHSIYGYLFLKYFTPLDDMASVVLYHHSNKDVYMDINPKISAYSQLISLCDKIDIALQNNIDFKDLYSHIKSLNMFSDYYLNILSKFIEKGDIDFSLALSHAKETIKTLKITEEMAVKYLEALVYTSDFISQNHLLLALTTSSICSFLAGIFLLPANLKSNLYTASLVYNIRRLFKNENDLKKNGELISIFHEDVIEIAFYSKKNKNTTKDYHLNLAKEIAYTANIIAPILLENSTPENLNWENAVKSIESYVKIGRIKEEIAVEFLNYKTPLDEKIKNQNNYLLIKYRALEKEYLERLKMVKE